MRIGNWQDGHVPLFVNTTILRRPVDELLALLLGQLSTGLPMALEGERSGEVTDLMVRTSGL